MAFLYNHIARKTLLTVILAWGDFSFYLANSNNLVLFFIMLAISALGLILIWNEVAPVFLLILLSFTSAYAFNTYLLQLNIPLYLIMIGILIVFGYLFTYTEQRIGILGDKRLIFLLLFAIIVLEVFLTLTYFLVNPIVQSLIITAVCYLFVGYCYTIIAKHTDNKFITYILLSGLAMAAILLTASWGG